MARPKKQFTDAMNLTISQMVEINKTLLEIKSELKKLYDFDVTEPTLATHIKSMGYNKVDNRVTNTSQKKAKEDKFSEVQKRFIEYHYWGGFSLNEILKKFNKEFNEEITESVLVKYIQKNGIDRFDLFIKGTTIDDIDNEEEKELYEIAKGWNDKILEQTREDISMYRAMRYMNGELYDISDNINTLWYDRNGMLRIIASGNTYLTEDGYETNMGTYRSGYALEEDVKFYDYKKLSPALSPNLVKMRKKMKSWYNSNKDLINRLYDIIMAEFVRDDVTDEYLKNIPQLHQFNKLCRELYEFKIRYAEVMHGKDSAIAKMMRCESIKKEEMERVIREYIPNYNPKES